jgi:hypothetical protein
VTSLRPFPKVRQNCHPGSLAHGLRPTRVFQQSAPIQTAEQHRGESSAARAIGDLALSTALRLSQLFHRCLRKAHNMEQRAQYKTTIDRRKVRCQLSEINCGPFLHLECQAISGHSRRPSARFSRVVSKQRRSFALSRLIFEAACRCNEKVIEFASLRNNGLFRTNRMIDTGVKAI